MPALISETSSHVDRALQGAPTSQATGSGYAACVNGNLVWIDCEMTGLDLARDALIEVAAVVTDSNLTPVDAGIEVVIHADEVALEGMVEVVRAMHAKSGLTEEVRASAVTLSEAEELILGYVTRHISEPNSAPLCGNTIATDRAFLARDMPRLDMYLHYRMVDVSSIKELCRRWYPPVYYGQPAKGLAHRALADIFESIRELEYYRQAVFVPLPGPSSESVAAIAAELLRGQEQREQASAGHPELGPPLNSTTN
jgi:oligoribonuclease